MIKKHHFLAVFILLLSVSFTPMIGQAQSLKDELAAKVKPKKKKKVEDEGMTSELHKKHVGQIVFANEKITRETDGSQFKTKFNISDFIYARAYFHHSIKNQPLYHYAGKRYRDKKSKEKPCDKVDCRYGVRVYVDGEYNSDLSECSWLEGDETNQTTIQFWIHQSPEDDPNRDLYQEFVTSLPEGEHTITVDIYSGDCSWLSEYSRTFSDPMAVGEFTLVKNEGDQLSIGRTFTDFEEGMQNEELKTQLFNDFKNFANNAKWNRIYTDIKIKGNRWEIVRSELTDLPKYRWIDIWVLAQWPDGHCTVESASMTQQYDGKDYSGAFDVSGTGDQIRVDCQ